MYTLPKPPVQIEIVIYADDMTLLAVPVPKSRLLFAKVKQTNGQIRGAQ